MENIVSLVTVEMNKTIEEDRMTAIEYIRLVKKLRNNEETDIRRIISDYIQELNEKLISEVSKGNWEFASGITDMIHFLENIIESIEEDIEVVDKETIAESFAKVSWEVNVDKLDKVCDILDMDNPLKGKEDMLISEVPMNLLYKLIKLHKAIIAYEEEHSSDDDYDVSENHITLLTEGANLDILIFRIDKEIRDTSEEEIDDNESEPVEETIDEAYMTFMINRACEATSIPNYIEPLYNTPLSELTDKDIAVIESMASLLNALDNKYDFGDAVVEGVIELSTLLSDIYESRK